MARYARRPAKPKSYCPETETRDAEPREGMGLFCIACDREVRVRVNGESFKHYPVKDASKTDKTHSRHLVKTYGMTGEQYETLLAFQGGCCYICKNKPKTKRFAVDHDHATGNVRGILCRSCNYKLLGGSKDDPERLLRAIDYLREPPASLCFDTHIRKED